MHATGPMVQLHADFIDREEARLILMLAQGTALGTAGEPEQWQRYVERVWPGSVETTPTSFETEDPNWSWKFNGQPVSLGGLKRQLGYHWGVGVEVG